MSSLIESQKSISMGQNENFNLTFEEQDADEIQARIAKLSSQEEKLTKKLRVERNNLMN